MQVECSVGVRERAERGREELEKSEFFFLFLRNEKNELIWELDFKKRKKESEESVGGLLKKFRGQDGHFV